jgi:hypothetical protein
MLSDEELRTVLAAQKTVISAAQAAYFAMVREVDRRPGFVTGAQPGAEARTFLRILGAETPAEDVRLARALGELPQLGKALSVGEANRGQVRVAEQAIRSIRDADPAALDGRLGDVDAALTGAARDLPLTQFKAATRRLVAHLHPNSGDTLDERAHERRELKVWEAPDGLVGIQGYLAADVGVWLRGVFDRWAGPDPATDDATGRRIPDPRSMGQRQADALGVALRFALGASRRTQPDRPHVVIHVRPDSVTADNGLSQAWVGRFLCDATVERVSHDRNGRVLALGRMARTAPPPLRRVLIGRDRCCVIPNCTVPAAYCDAHHVIWWERGGETQLRNLAMVCGRHHTETHAGIWEIQMREGIPWVKPPRWLDPEQRWRRNTYQEHTEAMERLALDFRPPPGTT